MATPPKVSSVRADLRMSTSRPRRASGRAYCLSWPGRPALHLELSEEVGAVAHHTRRGGRSSLYLRRPYVELRGWRESEIEHYQPLDAGSPSFSPQLRPCPNMSLGFKRSANRSPPCARGPCRPGEQQRAQVGVSDLFSGTYSLSFKRRRPNADPTFDGRSVTAEGQTYFRTPRSTDSEEMPAD